MTDPYEILGISVDSDDDAIRRRYIELVKQYSPERHPEKFAAVRQAYENLKNVETRLHRRLFEDGRHESIEALIEDMRCQTVRRRLSLSTLLSVVRKS